MSTCKIMHMRTSTIQTSSPTHTHPPVPGSHPTPCPQHSPNPLSPTLTQPPAPDTHPTPCPRHTPIPLSPAHTQPPVPDTHPSPCPRHTPVYAHKNLTPKAADVHSI